jgi:DNA-directed RNA polymerase specialized sigma24 family protein
MHAERAAGMEKSLASLPPELEAVVRMHLLEELTMVEVARRLRIGVSAAWRRFHRGLELYTKHLPPGSIDGGASG